MEDTALRLLSGPRHELALFAQCGFLFFGIEQLLFDWIWLGRAGWRAVTVYRRFPRTTMASLAAPVAPGRFAILIGAWDEAPVIATTLSTALDRWGDADYRIYVATVAGQKFASLDRTIISNRWGHLLSDRGESVRLAA